MSRNTNLGGLTPEKLGFQLLDATSRSAPIEEIRYLIDLGADVNIRNNNNKTPLHRACYRNNLEIATLLIQNHADVNLSLVEAFVLYGERGAIDDIINNRVEGPIELHIRPNSNTAILDMLHFPMEFNGTIHFVDNQGHSLIGDNGYAVELHCDIGYTLK
jgi:ankyrin repeat protein